MAFILRLVTTHLDIGVYTGHPFIIHFGVRSGFAAASEGCQTIRAYLDESVDVQFSMKIK